MLTGVYGAISTAGKIAARQLAFWQSLIFTLHNSKLLVATYDTQRRDSAIYPPLPFPLDMLQSLHPLAITTLCMLAYTDSSK